jgi:hypothetical protein
MFNGINGLGAVGKANATITDNTKGRFTWGVKAILLLKIVKIRASHWLKFWNQPEGLYMRSEGQCFEKNF